MFRHRLASLFLILLCAFSSAACASKYYKVTDANSGKIYYTTKVTNRKSGGITFKDDRTGATVNIPASEVHAVSEGTYTEGLADN